MSCNIKLAVSKSSQLSVSLVVLACRAAHLCLLDKTCSILPRENTLPSFIFSLSFSLPCFLFHFVSVFLYKSLCLSFFLSIPVSQYNIAFYLASLLYFLYPQLPHLPVLFPTVLLSLFFLAVFLASLFPLPFCFPSPSLLLSIFILYYFGTSLSVLQFKATLPLWQWCSSLLCTWLNTRTGMHTPPLDN